MPIEDMNLQDMAASGLSAGALGLVGRMVALGASGKNQGFTLSLLWELPIALGMGTIGEGISQYLHLTGYVNYAMVISVAYVGPRIIDTLLTEGLARLSKKS